MATNHSSGARQGGLVILAGGALMVIGALLPYATIASGFGSVSFAGTDGDGVFVLGLGLAATLAGFLALNGSRSAGTAALIVGVLGALLIAVIFSNVADGVENASGEFVRASVGIGLWVSAIGTGVVILGSGLRGRATATGKIPMPTIGQFTPTLRVPSEGLASWSSPDPAGPITQLAGGLELAVVHRVDDWAQVRASNGWVGWVDGRRLVSFAPPPPATTTGPASISEP